MLVLKNNFQGDNKSKEKIKLTKINENQHCVWLCFGWFFVLVFFFEVGRVAELVYLFCFGSFWGGGGGC